MFQAFREHPQLVEYFDYDGEFEMNQGKYSESCRKSIKELLNQLVGNPILLFSAVTLINFDSREETITEEHFDVGGGEESYSSFFITKNGTRFTFSFPQIWKLDQFLLEEGVEGVIEGERVGRRYLFVSTILKNDTQGRKIVGEASVDHSTLLIFDTVLKKIYLFDSNGGIHPSVDAILTYYFSQLTLDTYQYIPSGELCRGWVLNHNLGLEYDKGCCVSWTLLFSIFLTKLEVDDPKLLYDQLYQMPEGEQTMMIYSFISKNFESPISNINFRNGKMLKGKLG